MNDTISTMLSRRSVRTYAKTDIPEDAVRQMLAAAMSAPSAANQRPWQFVVVRDKASLAKFVTIHSGTRFVADAALAIVMFADPNATTLPQYWRDDCAAATQNILLGAHALGFGGTWIGIGDNDTDTIEMVRTLLKVPQNYVAFNVISLGKPAETREPKDRYLADRVHLENW